MRPLSFRSVALVSALLVLCAWPLQPQQPPPGSTILVPDHAFPGGVLTGVVIGPDDKPLSNTQVEIGGGVPITLSGVVIGEEPPSKPQPDHPAPCQPDSSGHLPPGCEQRARPPLPILPSVNAPQDCASVLQQAQHILAQPANQAVDHILIGLSQPSAGNVAGAEAPAPAAAGGGTWLSKTGGGLTTDAAGRFAVCLGREANAFFKSVGGLKAEVEVTDYKEGGVSPEPPKFVQPNQHINLHGLLRQPGLEQGGNTWRVPAVYAISPNGERAVTAFKTPRDLQPGSVKFTFTGPNNQPLEFTGGVFKTLSATLDRSKLRSQEGADFSYTVQFGDGAVRPCVNVSVAGPVVLVQAPPPQIALDANGVGRFAGKIRATQVAPGSAIPFDIVPNITDCHEAAQPGPQGGETQPGAAAGGPAQPSSVANLHAAPPVPNPWAKQGEVMAPPPAAVKPASPGSQVGSTPMHTMDETVASKHAKMPPPIPVCTIQFTAPAISNVTGVNLLPPRTFTQQLGLNYYHIQGCNFGDAQGHVYLIFPPANGQPGFGTNVELYLMQGAVWGPNSLDVFLDPNFGGFPDEVVTLQVVTAKGLKAELTKCKFRAERKIVTLFWFPRSQVKLGSTANYFVTPVFHTTASSQTDSLIVVDNNNPQQGPVTATVDRAITNVGGPFTVQDDLWDFSKLQPDFVVQYATPYYDNWNGQGCDQTSGHWGTSWDSATVLRVHVQGCYHKGTGNWASSKAFYGLGIQLSGPKGMLPWPTNLK